VLNDIRVAKGEMREARAADIHAMYLNTAAYVDRTLGEVLADVERTTGQVPVVVALGDHGESLYEEGFLGHGYASNDVQTRIAFVTRGLPMALAEPFGQSDLRDAIWRALSQGGPGRPTAMTLHGKQILQYVGNLNNPEQLAFRSPSLVAFDLWADRIRRGEQQWGALESADASTLSEWTEMVHLWERMKLPD
jgi:arylsulfatase A-like enzyme